MNLVFEKVRLKLQSVGGFMAATVIPNIGAFMAWGLIAALFTPTGWFPNPFFARLVEPMLFNLLPVLIGYSGGRLVYGVRGGVVGAVATMGVVSGSTIPMFIGAMAMGPLGGWCIKRLDRLFENRLPVGFEMLVSNFSAGIMGMALTLLAFVAVGPPARELTQALGSGAAMLYQASLLPLVAIVIEPGKVLFMNNAINHGVLAPLGVAEVREAGKSIFFLLETNPGPGLGLLLAYWIFGRGAAKRSSSGAILIHFFGGIHEMYFPYVLMKPSTLVALIAGGITANFIFVLTQAGLVATPSPGSIFAEMAMAPAGSSLAVLLGIAGGAICSCLVAMPIVRRAGLSDAESEEFDQARGRVNAWKAGGQRTPAQLTRLPETIFFVCEAGMGSSAIGEAVLKRKLREAGLDISVRHCAVNELRRYAEVVVSHSSLSARVREQAPQARLYPVADFVNSPAYERLVAECSELARR